MPNIINHSRCSCFGLRMQVSHKMVIAAEMLITKCKRKRKKTRDLPPTQPGLYLLYEAEANAEHCMPMAVHTPYEAPPTFMERFNFIADTPVGDTYPTADRQRYAAMTNFIDTAVGNVTDALRARGMWDDLLILSTSDNGGPIYKGNGWSGANDFVGTGHMGGNNFPCVSC